VTEDIINTETFTAPTLEELTRRLEKLTAENNKVRRKLKGKKTK
jgi:hypothetical protein